MLNKTDRGKHFEVDCPLNKNQSRREPSQILTVQSAEGKLQR